MSDEVIKVLDVLAERFGIVIDWSSETVLPYLKDVGHRFINYTTTMSVLNILLCIIIIFAVLKIIKEINKRPQLGVAYYGTDYEEPFHRIGLYTVCVLLIIGMIAAIVNKVGIIATCMTLPEKLFVKELLSLTKKG